jgi:5'-3' exonuclease
MHNILAQNGTTEYVGFLTSKTNFRKSIKLDSTSELVKEKEYKGNRKKELPKWFYTLKDWLTNELGFVTIEDLEADDCVCIYNNWAGPNRCVMVSTDKDFLQLEGTHFNPNLSIFKTINSEEAQLNLWIQVLMGDSTDNVSGIRGVGIKKAQGILANCPYRDSYHNKVLTKYIEAYGEYRGIELFYKTYVYVKLVDNHRNMVPEDICVHQINYMEPIETVIGYPSIDDIAIDGYRE